MSMLTAHFCVKRRIFNNQIAEIASIYKRQQLTFFTTYSRANKEPVSPHQRRAAGRPVFCTARANPACQHAPQGREQTGDHRAKRPNKPDQHENAAAHHRGGAAAGFVVVRHGAHANGGSGRAEVECKRPKRGQHRHETCGGARQAQVTRKARPDAWQTKMPMKRQGTETLKFPPWSPTPPPHCWGC